MRNAFYYLASLILFLQATTATIATTQSPRQIEIKVLDELDKPLANATVMVWSAAPRLGDELQVFGERQPPTPHVTGTTDPDGKASIDVSQLLLADHDGPMRVSVWKKGYGPQSLSVQKKGEFRCWPVRKRTVQIVDVEGKPLKGLRVEHALNEELDVGQSDLRWWTDEPTVTDEFGLATFQCPANGQLALAITESDGTLHRTFISESSRLTGRLADFRDTSVVHLVPHGKIEGSLSATFSHDYAVRVVRDFRGISRNMMNMTSLNGQAKVEPDGHFLFEAVAEGPHWLIVYAKKSYDSSSDGPLTSRPVALHKVDVVAGQTATVQIASETLAKVTGRVVSANTEIDLSGMQVTVAQTAASELATRIAQRHMIGRSICSADGSFVCWLPKGRYQLTAASTNKWKAGTPVDVEVGAGAAMITTKELIVTPLKTVNVVWHNEHRAPNSMMNYTDNRIVFQLKEGTSECQMTSDGYGQVQLPVNEEAKVILRETLYTGTQTASAFTDRDPSENFDLQLITTPQGTATNITMRGRVVDANGKGMGRVPVTISLSFETVSAQSTRSTVQGGSQVLDIIMTELDGSFQLPPRQLLSRMTIPGRVVTDQASFTFALSTPANPDPVEVRKEIKATPNTWDVLEIEFPDLVLDRPLDGDRLSGKVLDASGQPSPGELIRLSDKRRLVRTVSDQSGQFVIEDLAGPTWLLREKDWSIHSIGDYSQARVLSLESSTSKPIEADANTTTWQRPTKDQRIKLAKELLQGMPQAQRPAMMIPAGILAQSVPDEFYLEPDKAFQQLLLLNRPDADGLRLQFVSFWSDLRGDQLQQLADVMSDANNRVQILRIKADQSPSPAAYESVMRAIEFPARTDRVQRNADSMLDHLASVAMKLHNYGMLEPYREKIRSFLQQYATEAKAPTNLPELPANLRALSTMERGSLQICRALLDPEQYAADALEAMVASGQEPSNEEQMAQIRNSSLFLQLFPTQLDKLPADRLGMNEQSLISWGEQAPLEALVAFKQGKLSPEMLRTIATSALMSGHPDAVQFFTESNSIVLRIDLTRAQSLFTLPGRSPELAWYQAARRTSAELGKVAAWHLAYDYLSGRYRENTFSILPMRDRHYQQTLATAYCLMDEYPELGQQLAQRAVPQMLKSIEKEFDHAYGRNSDIGLVAWFDPQAACDLIIKLNKQLEESQKNQPAGKTDPMLFGKARNLSGLRLTCLRGLLLDRL